MASGIKITTQTWFSVSVSWTTAASKMGDSYNHNQLTDFKITRKFLSNLTTNW